MTENQKLREALPPLHTGCLPTLNQDPYPALGDWWVQLWDGSGDDAKVIVRVYGNSPEQAKQRAEAMCQALALPTAAPVGEREAFKAWLGITPCGAAHDFGWAAWQARAALSAGDAVDAQRYRWLREQCNHKGTEGSRIASREYGMDWDAAIDKAMRKGQL